MNDAIDLTKEYIANQSELKASHAEVVVQEGQGKVRNIQEKPSPFSLEVTFEQQVIKSISLQFEKKPDLDFKLHVFYQTASGYWQKLPVQSAEWQETKLELQIPLSTFSNIKIVFFRDDYLAFKLPDFTITLGYKPNIEVTASSFQDRLSTPENLVDHREDYGWVSKYQNESTKEWVLFDFRDFFYIHTIILKSAPDTRNGFPANFSLLLSTDGKVWDQVFSEADFVVPASEAFGWSIIPRKARFAKIEIHSLRRNEDKNYYAKIMEATFLASTETVNSVLQGVSDLPYASESIPGIVTLSEWGGQSAGKVVQANDPRLRKASNQQPGIVQFAADGDRGENLAVMASDHRLREASEKYPGIVQLAMHGEVMSKKAVQSDDPRLREATEDFPGIVQLAEDGADKKGSALQSSDRRLKPASTKEYGLAVLAEDKEESPGKVLQANDSRIKKATTEAEGIVRLARHFEEAAEAALASNDPRLVEGSESRPGRVQFARNGEEAANKAVQANDDRLKAASVEKAGITILSKPGEAVQGRVVESTDPRLSDPRNPLPHEHDYAKKTHEHNSHTGSLNLSMDVKTEKLRNMQQVLISSLPLSVENKGGVAAGFEGGIQSSSDKQVALSARSTDAPAIESLGHEQPAIVALSQKDYALLLPKAFGDKIGSGKSLMAEGSAVFNGGVRVTGNLSLVVGWSEFSSDAFSEGDLVSVQADGKLCKVKNANDVCVGTVASEAGLVHDLGASEKKLWIAVSGIAKVKVKGSVQAGDRIGYSRNQYGVGVSDKAGTFAVALETSSLDKERLVWCLLK